MLNKPYSTNGEDNFLKIFKFEITKRLNYDLFIYFDFLNQVDYYTVKVHDHILFNRVSYLNQFNCVCFIYATMFDARIMSTVS